MSIHFFLILSGKKFFLFFFQCVFLSALHVGSVHFSIRPLNRGENEDLSKTDSFGICGSHYMHFTQFFLSRENKIKCRKTQLVTPVKLLSSIFLLFSLPKYLETLLSLLYYASRSRTQLSAFKNGNLSYSLSYSLEWDKWYGLHCPIHWSYIK